MNRLLDAAIPPAAFLFYLGVALLAYPWMWLARRQGLILERLFPRT